MGISMPVNGQRVHRVCSAIVLAAAVVWVACVVFWPSLVERILQSRLAFTVFAAWCLCFGDGQIIGCGGWSKRRSLYGGDQSRMEQDAELDPERDAARVRAFFVHPAWARCGIGRSIMAACERAIIQARFHRVEIVATLAGEPLYAAFAYTVIER